jgi:hypothetical protein
MIKPTTSEIKEDIKGIMAEVNNPTDDEVVYIPDKDKIHVKVYIYKKNVWEFQSKIKKEDVKHDIDWKIKAPKDKVTPKVKKMKMFTFTDIKTKIDEKNLDAAKDMIDQVIALIGDTVPKKKREKNTDDSKPPREKTAYQVFMSEKLAELKGNPSIPVNERMKVVSEMWKKHKEEVAGADAGPSQ